MSWDADLVVVVDGQDVSLDCSWNYTHNTNKMIATVLERAGGAIREHFLVGKCWWDVLNGKSAREGGEILDTIINGLFANPAVFRAMNPANGWGSYDGLLVVLRKMRAAAEKWPSGVWRISG